MPRIEKRHLFEEGDAIKLKKKWREKAEEFGNDGFFIVLEAENIPADKCDCGGSKNDKNHQIMNGLCPFSG